MPAKVLFPTLPTDKCLSVFVVREKMENGKELRRACLDEQ